MRRILKASLALAFGLGLTRVSQAAVTDMLTVTITPNAFYSVVIDTTNVSLNLGTVGLSASTQTVSPSSVTIQSTFATTDLKLQGAIASAGTPWTFDADSTTVEADALAAWATFTSVARSSAPSQSADYFSGTAPGAASSDMIDTTNRYVGSSANDGTSNLFENNSNFDSKDMDALPPLPAAAGRAHLWLFFRMPSASTSSTAQNISILLTAVAPN